MDKGQRMGGSGQGRARRGTGEADATQTASAQSNCSRPNSASPPYPRARTLLGPACDSRVTRVWRTRRVLKSWTI